MDPDRRFDLYGRMCYNINIPAVCVLKGKFLNQHQRIGSLTLDAAVDLVPRGKGTLSI